MKINEMWDKARDGGYRDSHITFQHDLERMFVEHGATPRQAEMAGSIAWENGHSGGYTEVMNHASDLVRIFEG